MKTSDTKFRDPKGWDQTSGLFAANLSENGICFGHDGATAENTFRSAGSPAANAALRRRIQEQGPAAIFLAQLFGLLRCWTA